MNLGKVQPRGQVTIPQEVRQACGIEPGTILVFAVPRRGQLTARVLPTHASMGEVVARFGATGSLDPSAWDTVGADMTRDVLEEPERREGPPVG